ncbi:hypothetical protein H257_12751 [Aphanomyces astaci]|uniref:Replication protein n=1 Tax=Aphanomyces astaci TaxID=112090 RepID=W4FYM9_APHAT|nr:hypothetical protein H257_12751 [Aphanomyces astaci]ETV71914.1 hypothetical protein H257_12751 [Aphanomyces astaci]RQM10937.1 hypothetical protein B5M09_010420 [Aphanomyces astaci]|eukprot:XP_009838357.1 hypothetical protein H257_12751 [Aphanomyces astaci]
MSTINNNKQVAYNTEDRQWDARINVQDDAYLQSIIDNIVLENARGKFKYILIGGVEVGTRPNQTEYQVKHIHVAAIFHNRESKASILKNWDVIEGNGYYLVPRNRDLPYQGWKDHHTKEFSKVSSDKKDWILFEEGELPKDQGQGIKRKGPVLRSESEKKMKTDEVIIDMRRMIEEGKADEAFETYPRNYMIYGERIKSMVHQKKKAFFGKHTDPHLYLHGFPGTGKTSLLQFIYGNYYKKNLENRFWDLYDEEVHTHVMLEDLDSLVLDRLGVQFIKTICDEAGFAIDQKYKAPQLTRATILVTSNQDIDQLINCCDEVKLIESTKAALKRRFYQLRVDQLQRLLGLKLIPAYDRKMLKKAGNEDPSKLYMDYDYIQDCPTGLPIKTPEYYRQVIKDKYYQ